MSNKSEQRFRNRSSSKKCSLTFNCQVNEPSSRTRCPGTQIVVDWVVTIARLAVVVPAGTPLDFEYLQSGRWGLGDLLASPLVISDRGVGVGRSTVQNYTR